MNAIFEERGPSDPEAVALARRLNALMWPELAILLVVLLAMTTKPTGSGFPGFWAAVVVALAAAVALVARGLRSAQLPASASS